MNTFVRSQDTPVSSMIGRDMSASMDRERMDRALQLWIGITLYEHERLMKLGLRMIRNLKI